MKILLFFFLFTELIHAKSLTPFELSSLAQERAPLIKMYLEQESVSQGQLKQSRVFANPVLTYQGGRLKSGTQNGQVTDLTLMQPLPWPGKREALIKSQEFLNRIAQMDVVEAKLLLGHKIYLLAYQLGLEVELEKHHKERKERFSLMARYLSTRPLASPKQSLEKELIESQIRLVEKMMLELSARKNGLLQELKLWTGEEDLDLKVDWNKLPRPHEKEFYATHLQDAPRLKKLDQMLRLSENKIEEAKLQARPDIMVGVNYRQENVAPTNHFYHGQVAVVIPIVDRGQHTVQTAKAQVRKDEASIKMAMQETNIDLNHSYEMLKSTLSGLDLFPLNLHQKSEQRFRKAEDAFRKGQIDIMTFLQSDTQVHENIDLIYSTRLQYLTALSHLEQLIGHHLELN